MRLNDLESPCSARLTGLDPKSLWRESAHSQTSRQVFVSAGRQQQAGKVALLAGCEPYLTLEDSEESHADYRVIFLGHASGAVKFSEVVKQATGEIVLEDTGSIVSENLFRILSRAFIHFRRFRPLRCESPNKDSFLTRVQRLEKSGHIEAALDLLYDQIDGMLKAEKFKEVDIILLGLDVPSISLNLLLGFLTATLPARSKLRSRRWFFERVEAALRERGELEENLLVGLES